MREKEPRKARRQRIENEYGMSPGPLARKMYKEQKSLSDIGMELNVPSRTIADWIKQEGIHLRSTSEALTIRWKNAEKRENMLNKMHSPQAERRRSTSLKNYWDNHPDSEEGILRTAKARKARHPKRI